MHAKAPQHLTLFLGTWLAATTLLLWSWNALIDLFGMPRAEFRHALAATIIVLCLRWCLFRRPRNNRGCGYGDD